LLCPGAYAIAGLLVAEFSAASAAMNWNDQFFSSLDPAIVIFIALVAGARFGDMDCRDGWYRPCVGNFARRSNRSCDSGRRTATLFGGCGPRRTRPASISGRRSFFPPDDPRFEQILTQIQRERDERIGRLRRDKKKWATARPHRRRVPHR
jgi:hypothetical protein